MTPLHEPELVGPGEPLPAPQPALVAALDGGAQLVTNPRARRAHRLDIVAKRALDIVLALLLLVMLVPLVALLAIVIQLDSRGPTFFRCERVGYRGRRLMMLKFRKMRDGAAGWPLTLENDPRFTRIGASLSRLKLDEIPQLWHVLRGEMSLVGPRPESSRFVDCYPHEYERILSTRPGIVGLSQLAFVDESRILDDRDPVRHYIEEILPHKVELDLLYVERHSVWFDLRILLWSTVAVLLRRPVLVDPATGRVRWGGRR
jgi:lipopolysaccharide/colanic/teichoic acid biosynthesis glycosyltransferase